MKSKKPVLFFLTVLVLAILAAVFTLNRKDDVLAPSNGFDDRLAVDSPKKQVEFKTEVIVSNLTKPWGVDFLPDGSLFFTERAGAINLFKDGVIKQLFVPADLDARGEGGLLGVAVDPNFDTTNYVYVCYNTTNDVRVVRWRLEDENLLDEKVVVDGIPTASNGRHSGCRPAFGPDGYLWVATGDAAIGSTPQESLSLGGKILRIDSEGNAASGNLGSPFDSRIYSYGHRNLQGIAFKQGSSFIGVSSEHGPDRDDEINSLLPGNFGWDPIPGYNESVPMTDQEKYPDAISSLWSSGKPTVALSGATFVSGDEWGSIDGYLMAATLKAKRILLFSVDNEGKLTPQEELFKDEFGRIRSVEQSPMGAIYITTDNGKGNDVIIKVSPQ